MRKLLRNMARTKMAQTGYSKINKRMGNGRWRQVIGASPTNVITGEKMTGGFRGKKKYKAGHWQHLFAY